MTPAEEVRQLRQQLVALQQALQWSEKCCSDAKKFADEGWDEARAAHQRIVAVETEVRRLRQSLEGDGR